MKILWFALPVIFLVVKQVWVNKLRKKRDHIDLSTYEGKKECRRINRKINALNLVFWK